MRGADCNTRQFVVESVEQRFGYLGRLGGSDNVDREAFDRKYTRRLNLQQTEAVHAVDGAVLLLAVGCGGSEKILSTEGVPQEVLQSAQYKAALAEETPVGRLGTPEEVAKLLVFLASEDAGYITGQVFGVNGGLVI